jgi:hypothetical protein
MQVIYNGNRMPHLSFREVDLEVMVWRKTGDIISDAAAQSIAGRWAHGTGESTILSTRGIVTATMSIYDFVSEKERNSPFRTDEETAEIDALEAYIVSKQKESGMVVCDGCDTLAICEYGDSANICQECAEVEE